MPRKPSVPKLCQHKASGKAVVRLNGRDHYLGVFGTPEAKNAYDRLIAEWLAAGRRNPKEIVKTEASKPVPISVNEVLLAFWRHAEKYYRTLTGEPSPEISALQKALRPVTELYGLSPAVEFGPRALAAVRQRLVDAKLCRNQVNKRIDRVKRVFKWAASEELVPVSVYESLRTLAGLRRGRTEARETDPVKPVAPQHVTATLPNLNQHIRAMVELQRYTGMRPGEVCGITLAEVDRTGALWVYRPAQHKTAHHGRERVILIGPKAQAALVAFLRRAGIPPEGFSHININDPDQSNARLVMADAYQEAGRESDAMLLRDLSRQIAIVAGCVVDPSAPLFSPREAREERYRVLRANRKSKVPPSQRNRRKMNLKRSPAARYTPESYAHAVQKATAKANVPHWHPNQLRHLFATEVRRLARGLEAAQILLGHASANITQVYAERDMELAAKVASEIG